MSYQPAYTITSRLLGEVEQVAALHERIQAAAVQVPWIPALQKDTRTRNAHSSTAIEGNPLTLEQVRAVEEGREIPAVAARAKREVVNYFAALRFVEKNGRPLSNDSRAGGKLCGAPTGKGTADDVGLPGVVEYKSGQDFAGSELGHHSSPFRSDSSVR